MDKIKRYIIKNKTIKKIIEATISRSQFYSWRNYIKTINANIADSESIIDLWCWKWSLIWCNIKEKYVIGIDIFWSSLDCLKESSEWYNKLINDNILNINKHFKEKSIDTIIMMDVLEHLEKDKAKKLLYTIEKIARKKIIIQTPNWFLKQDPYDWNEYQRHLSGWDVDFFKKNWFQKIYWMRWLKLLRREYWQAIIPIIIDFISEITEFFVYKKPQYAFQLLAIKNINSQ